MQGIKINRITVYISDSETVVSLCRGNRKFGEVTNSDLGIPCYIDSGLPNQQVYQQYCRDLLIHLLEQNGVDGFYYEAKEESIGASNTPKKYDKATFEVVTQRQISDMLHNMGYEQSTLSNGLIDVIESYKDKYIKFATIEYDVKVGENDKIFKVKGELKSGQLCRPKNMTYQGTEMKFNQTNIKRIFS